MPSNEEKAQLQTSQSFALAGPGFSGTAAIAFRIESRFCREVSSTRKAGDRALLISEAHFSITDVRNERLETGQLFQVSALTSPASTVHLAFVKLQTLKTLMQSSDTAENALKTLTTLA